MEIGVDFGLFELLAAAGLSSLARFIFRRRWLSVAFLVWSAAAPLALFLFVEGEGLRWLVVGCVSAAAIHITAIVLLMRRHDLADLLGAPVASRGAARRGA
jgi:4-hydroxybenzoate polyprenyltransferase